MKSLSVREMRKVLPKLEKLLAKHTETIARLLPAKREIDWSAHEGLRASMAFQEIPSEALIREDRDSR